MSVGSIDTTSMGSTPMTKAITTNSALGNLINKIVFYLSLKGYPGLQACTDFRLACPIWNFPDAPNNQVEVWKLDSKPTKLFTFGPIEKDQLGPMYEVDGKLFVQYLNHSVQACTLDKGLPFPLPNDFKNIERFSASEKFNAHINSNFYNQDPNKIFLSKPHTYEVFKVLYTDIAWTFDMIIGGDKIIHIGLTDNKEGKIIVFKDPMNSDESISATFQYDGFGNYMYVLDEKSGLIFNHNWAGSTNQIWDANTLEVVMHRSFPEAVNFNPTVILDRFAASATTNSIEIYERVNPNGKMELVRTINLFGKLNYLCCFTVINFGDKFLACAGFGDGNVMLWDIQTAEQFAVLPPLEKMEVAQTLQMAGDKLLVSYNIYSKDNTVAICWDLNQRQPYLKITRDSPKVDSEFPDDVLFDTKTGNIIVRTGKEVIVHEKFAPPSNEPNSRIGSFQHSSQYSSSEGKRTAQKITPIWAAIKNS